MYLICRSAAGVVQLYGNIYALGGHNGLSIFESVEVYDPATNEWDETVINHGLGRYHDAIQQ